MEWSEILRGFENLHEGECKRNRPGTCLSVIAARGAGDGQAADRPTGQEWSWPRRRCYSPGRLRRPPYTVCAYHRRARVAAPTRQPRNVRRAAPMWFRRTLTLQRNRKSKAMPRYLRSSLMLMVRC